MSRSAIDVQVDTTGRGQALFDRGIRYVGLYLRSDRASKRMVDDLHHAGIKVFGVFEKGYPISASYFTERQGRLDGLIARQFASQIGWPSGANIFSAVDFDPSSLEITQSIVPYQTAFRQSVKGYGYLASVYGSGLVCSTLIAKGIAHYGWLSQSKGFAGYQEFLPTAAIVQGPELKDFMGMNVDLDTVLIDTAAW